MDRGSTLGSEMGRKLVEWTAKDAWLHHVSVSVANRDAVEMDMPLQEGESAILLDWDNSRLCRPLCHSDEQLQDALCSHFANSECSPMKQQHQTCLFCFHHYFMTGEGMDLRPSSTSAHLTQLIFLFLKRCKNNLLPLSLKKTNIWSV